MAPKATAQDKLKLKTWQVTGGAISGGLLVRKGPETRSTELSEKLATGALIQELEVQGERMRYKRVKGTGPDEGWISTKFKGKDQIKARPMRVWIMSAGTRGDLQPFLALGLELKRAGYDVSIWSCEDYRGFVESYGISFHGIVRSCEDFIKEATGLKSTKGKDAEWMDSSLRLREDMARWRLSQTCNKPCNGFDYTKGLPPYIEEQVPPEHLLGLCSEALGYAMYWDQKDVVDLYSKAIERYQRAIEGRDLGALSPGRPASEAGGHGESGSLDSGWGQATAQPPAFLRSCDACEREPEEAAVVRCLNCEAFLCAACDGENHSTELLQRHVRRYFQEVPEELCASCQQEPAAVRCLNCDAALCAACDGWHHFTKLLRRHVRQPTAKAARVPGELESEAAAAPEPVPAQEAVTVPEAAPAQEAESGLVNLATVNLALAERSALEASQAADIPFAEHIPEILNGLKEEYARAAGDQHALAFIRDIQYLFMVFFAWDMEKVNHLRGELEWNQPDLVLHNSFWPLIAYGIELKCDAPAIQLDLQASGMVMWDPHALWLTPDAWPWIRQMNPALMEYDTLEDARREFKMKEEIDTIGWLHALLMEALIVQPLLGVSPVAEMGVHAYYRRQSQAHLCGFLSSIASKNFLQILGEFTASQVTKHHYTGFWLIPDSEQRGGFNDMFGGPDLMKRMEDFIAAGEPPAYLGWGSCVSGRGRHWMCGLAVGALKEAGMRGIILSGWAELNMALLEDLVGSDDSLGLVEYARKNVLFVEKAPQVWLFPKCSVVVIHGGVGTLAAAWTSGTPLIVLPVWMDQFMNQWLNNVMGAGVGNSTVDDTSPSQLAEVMKQAVTDPAVKRGAQVVQFSMARDHGTKNACAFLNRFISEDVPSGKWKHRFDPL